MAQVKDRRNNLLAGGLVLFSIAATIAFIIMISGGIDLIGKQKYVVEFSLADGVTGLARGSEVRLGGRKIGAVGGIQFHRNADGAVESIRVNISIDGSVKLHGGAVAFLEAPLLASKSILNFPDVGIDGEEIQHGHIIPGRIAPPALLAQAGYGDEEASRVRSIIENIDIAAAKSREFMEWMQAEGRPKADTLLTDASSVMSDARADYGEWRVQVGDMMDGGQVFAQGLPQLRTDSEDMIAEMRTVIDRMQSVVDESGANMNTATANWVDFSARAKGEISDKAVALLDKGQSALSEVQVTIEKASTFLSEQTPNMRNAAANFRLAADQLALTLIEVRRSPWRLLYRPDMREVEYELLYDSARTYAAAVSDLRAASESLESVLASDGSRLASAGQTVEEITAELEEARKKYKQAENQFLNVLMETDSE